MILIADSGSTKTDWCLIHESEKPVFFTTQGINPFHQSREEIDRILHQEVVPAEKECVAKGAPIKEIFFYGAGCTTEKAPILQAALQEVFPQASIIEVASDMLGAARSLCGHQPGIVCILGTGSNSCYYDGKQITHNTPPLGYILGDEGSGAALGKRLAGDCLKHQLPEEVCKRFLAQYQLSLPEIIERVYRQPMANRFLANCSRFLYENRHEPSIRQLLTECFGDFIRRNILSYPKGALFFTGSVAHYYAEELKEAAALYHLQIANIAQRPMEGLIAFHSKIKVS